MSNVVDIFSKVKKVEEYAPDDAVEVILDVPAIEFIIDVLDDFLETGEVASGDLMVAFTHFATLVDQLLANMPENQDEPANDNPE